MVSGLRRLALGLGAPPEPCPAHGTIQTCGISYADRKLGWPDYRGRSEDRYLWQTVCSSCMALMHCNSLGFCVKCVLVCWGIEEKSCLQYAWQVPGAQITAASHEAPVVFRCHTHE